ncbi:hypothetical protein HMPREF0379_0535 [[Eubacterium] yurii subsp. margaretiae ATCC 43715]|nr:hypothetical protein HMPREF0379_0535 [[Eubacterium] yurii subsp. margaretiae ATCC 43715]
MDNDNKTKLIKFLKIMSAYFVLYFIHYIIMPNSFIYSDPENAAFIMAWMFLLFPLVDILLLKSNILYGTIGIVFYILCIYIYSANGAYGMGRGALLGTGKFMYENLLFELEFGTILYIIDYSIIFIIVFIIRKIREYIRKKEEERWNS